MSGFSAPSIEDSMAMVGVALVLYGLIKFVSWTFASSGNKIIQKQNREKSFVFILASNFLSFISLFIGSDEAEKQDKVMLLQRKY